MEGTFLDSILLPPAVNQTSAQSVKNNNDSGAKQKIEPNMVFLNTLFQRTSAVVKHSTALTPEDIKSLTKYFPTDLLVK